MNPKDGFNFNEILWSFLDKAEGGAKNYERDHPLPLAWRPFTVILATLYRRFPEAKGYQTFAHASNVTHFSCKS